MEHLFCLIGHSHLVGRSELLNSRSSFPNCIFYGNSDQNPVKMSRFQLVYLSRLEPYTTATRIQYHTVQKHFNPNCAVVQDNKAERVFLLRYNAKSAVFFVHQLFEGCQIE